MNYEDQLKYKDNEVTENLNRIGKTNEYVKLPIIKSEKTYYYRNKMEFSFSNSRWITEKEIHEGNRINNKNALGFHKSGMWNKVIDIKKCFLLDEILKNRNFIKKRTKS